MRLCFGVKGSQKTELFRRCCHRSKLLFLIQVTHFKFDFLKSVQWCNFCSLMNVRLNFDDILIPPHVILMPIYNNDIVVITEYLTKSIWWSAGGIIDIFFFRPILPSKLKMMNSLLRMRFRVTTRSLRCGEIKHIFIEQTYVII